MDGAHDELARSEPNMVTLDYLMCRTDKRTVIKTQKQAGTPVNSTPFVRQYDILSNKWGVLLCQKENQTNDIRRNSKNW